MAYVTGPLSTHTRQPNPRASSENPGQALNQCSAESRDSLPCHPKVQQRASMQRCFQKRESEAD